MQQFARSPAVMDRRYRLNVALEDYRKIILTEVTLSAINRVNTPAPSPGDFMRTRILAAVGTVTLVMAPVLVAAQAAPGTKSFNPTVVDTEAAIKAATEAAKASAGTANWTPSRTAWGDPDLQGYWLSLSYTPLE